MQKLAIPTNQVGFPTSDKDVIYFETEKPVRYKGNCKEGRFFRGATNRDLGQQLTNIQPLHFYTFTGKLYKTKNPDTNWGELIFLDEKNSVSSILIKGESLDKFKAIVQDSVRYDNVQPIELSLSAKMSPRSSENGDYFAIEWTFGKAAENKVELASEFLLNEGKNGLYNIFTIQEYAVKQKLANSFEDCTKEVLLQAATQMNLISAETA